MYALKQKLKAFLADEQGATAVEYGLFVAAIAAVIVAIVVTLGGNINTAFTNVNTELQKATGGGGGGGTTTTTSTGG